MIIFHFLTLLSYCLLRVGYISLDEHKRVHGQVRGHDVSKFWTIKFLSLSTTCPRQARTCLSKACSRNICRNVCLMEMKCCPYLQFIIVCACGLRVCIIISISLHRTCRPTADNVHYTGFGTVIPTFMVAYIQAKYLHVPFTPYY